MSIRLPSTPAIHGLCAAFFLGAAINVVRYVLNIIYSWQRNHYSATLVGWTLAIGVGLLLSVVCVSVGIRLLYMRARCVVHGLILGWLFFVGYLAWFVEWVYTFTHGQHLAPGYWLPLLFGSAMSILCPAIVVWLLHGLRSRDHHDEQPLIGNIQIV